MSKKYKVLDLFCGAGGLSKGFEMAGFDIVGGVDFNQEAIDTYNHNFKKAKGICCDILNLSDEEIEEFQKLDERVSSIEKEPANDFKEIKKQIRNSTISVIIGAVIGAIITLLLK